MPSDGSAHDRGQPHRNQTPQRAPCFRHGIGPRALLWRHPLAQDHGVCWKRWSLNQVRMKSCVSVIYSFTLYVKDAHASVNDMQCTSQKGILHAVTCERALTWSAPSAKSTTHSAVVPKCDATGNNRVHTQVHHNEMVITGLPPMRSERDPPTT